MKRNNFLLLCIVCVFSISCQNKTFDLATIKLGDNAEKYNFGNNVIFEKTERCSGNAVAYISNEWIVFTFEEIPIDSTLNAWITVIDNKIADLDIYASGEYTLDFAKKLLADLGTPTAVFTDKTWIKQEIGQPIFAKFHSILPDNTKFTKGEYHMDYDFEYPYLLFWDKNDVYYIFSMTVDSNGEMRNRYHPVTKEGYKTGKVPFYPYPLPENSPLFGYMK